MNDRITKINRLYNECKKEFGLSNFNNDIVDELSNNDIKLFYRNLCDFFLQEEQKKHINKDD